MERCIPLELTNKISEKYPGCWDYVEKARVERARGDFKWDEKCYIPISFTKVIVTKGNDQRKFAPDFAKTSDAITMAAIAPWRLYKQIFSFAPEMEKLLYEQLEECVLPVDILSCLPYQCIYIQLKTVPGYDGFFVYFESDEDLELRLLLVHEDMWTLPLAIHLMPGGTISDGLKAMCKRSEREMKAYDILPGSGILNGKETLLFQYAAPLIQLVLYICSQNKEVEADPEQGKIVRIPKSKKFIKDKYREVKKYNCGEQTAKIIRGMYGTQTRTKQSFVSSTDSDSAGTPKRPHVRRGHWHHYWRGKQSEREIILKWIAPTFIHPEEADDETAVKINEVADNRKYEM